MATNQQYYMPQQQPGAGYQGTSFNTGGFNTPVIGGQQQAPAGPQPRTMGNGYSSGGGTSGGGAGGYSSYLDGRALNTGQQQAAANEGNWGNTYLQSYYNNPLKTMFGPGGGGINGLATQWGIGGLNYPDINNPNTMPTIGKWMSNLNGGLNASLDQYSRQMANAGVTASRGGMGVQGGQDPYAAMRAQQMGQIASQYGQNFDKSVGYMANAANYNRGLFGDILGALGSQYGTDVNAGVNLLGLQNSALQANAGNALQYAQMGQSAHDKDVAYANQTADANRQRSWQLEDEQRADKKRQGQEYNDRQAAAQQAAAAKEAAGPQEAYQKQMQDLQMRMYLNQLRQQEQQANLKGQKDTAETDTYLGALNDYTHRDAPWGVAGTWFPGQANAMVDTSLMTKYGSGGTAGMSKGSANGSPYMTTYNPNGQKVSGGW